MPYKDPKVRNAYLRAQYAANAESIRAKRRAWRAANLDLALERERAQYAANVERRLEYARAWRAANIERALERERARYAANPTRVREQAHAWNDANRDRIRENGQAWRAANPERVRDKSLVDRARKRAAPGTASIPQVSARWAMWGGLCWMCGAPATCTDHVKPLAKGGSGWPANLRPACGPCNSRKNKRWPFPTNRTGVTCRESTGLP